MSDDGFWGPSSARPYRLRLSSINPSYLAPQLLSFLAMANFASDLRHLLRMLGKSPLFTSMAIASLALGLGANTAIFSMLDQALDVLGAEISEEELAAQAEAAGELDEQT